MRENRIFRTAIYLRLSREDGDREESDSIGNQRRLLTEYMEAHPELQPAEEYVDDGWSGTGFDRPAFARMLRDIYAGRLDALLVKDAAVIAAPK